MAKRSTTPTADQPWPATEGSQSGSPVSLSPAAQIGLSIVVVMHLLAVVATPLMFMSRTGPDSNSPAAEMIEWPLRPYIQALYLNHGYAFFAPEPGPSHLVRYEIEREGQEPLIGEFPSRNDHWPRLYYHRHFMLSESMYSLYAPPRPPEKPPEPREDTRRARQIYQRNLAEWERMNAQWEERRKTYEALKASVENHLQKVHNATDVTLIRIEHRQPTPVEFLEQRMLLNDQETKRSLPEVPPAELLPWNPPSR